MNLEQLFTAVRDAYRDAPHPDQKISKVNYLAMVSAFGKLVPLANISDAYDTDFRRNLPGGGLSGFEVVALPRRIADAAVFAQTKPVYPPAGEGIAENIRAILSLLEPSAAQDILAPHMGTFKGILDGNL